MAYHQSGSIRYFSFDLFQNTGVVQAVFTRRGGVSPEPWDSLNVGLTVGDDPQHVIRNRELAFAAVRRAPETLSDSWLVHGHDAVIYDQPRPAGQKTPPKADIILTDNSEVTLFMRYADCVPIVLVDPVRRAIALAHAGWAGTVQHAAGHAVRAMQERYGSRPQDLLAGIGPAIGPERYEIGPEVVRAVHDAFGSQAEELLPRFGASTHLDLWAANRLTLAWAGVEQIEVSGLCTAEHNQDWYSHRSEDGRTGRFGVLLALEE
jgi:YfiH family protein